jgi:transposase-like protein
MAEPWGTLPADGPGSEARAYERLEAWRWPGGPECPHCGWHRVYFLRPREGTGRPTRHEGKVSERRVWKCARCRRQFSALTGTLVQGTKVPVRIWVDALVTLCTSETGISARDLERRYGLSPATAWSMIERMRAGMQRPPLVDALPAEALEPTRVSGPIDPSGFDPGGIIPRDDRVIVRSAPPASLAAFVRRVRRSARSRRPL